MAVSYGDYDFPDYSHIDIDLTTVFDATDRIPIEKRLTVTIRATVLPDSEIGAGATVTAHMDAIRNRLQKSGQKFSIQDHGFGTALIVNDPDEAESVFDIRGGPKPRVVKWNPIGANYAAEVVWTCDISLPPCEPDEWGNISEMSYGCSYKLNRGGFTTRTISGHIRTIQTVEAGGGVNPVVQDTVDRYRNFINVARLPNFHREQTYDITPDKQQLNFSITDTEIESPNAYPEGVVTISAPMRTRVRMPNAQTNQALNSLSVRIELDATAPRVKAWEIFQTIFFARIQNVPGDSAVIITDMLVTEDWFNHQHDFQIEFRIVLPFNKIISALGYFQPLEFDWTQWADSMETAQDRRGHARLGLTSTSNDPLVNACEREDWTFTEETHTIPTPEPQTFAEFCNTPPPPNASYLRMDNRVTEAPMVEAVPISTYGAATVTTNDDAGDWRTTDDRTPFLKVDPDSDSETTISQAPPEQRWIWRGVAERLGYPIPPLPLPMIGDQETTIVGTPRQEHQQIGIMFCQPVFRRVWSVGLVVKKTPDEIQNMDPTGLNDQEDGDDAP